jgi:ABC-type transporter Mla MlaB component
VLRITRITDGNAVTFRLEGKLLEPWRAEVQRACSQLPSGVLHKRLDLSELTFADTTGVNLLRDLLQDDFEVANCSNFVAELLQMEEL